MPLAMSPQHGRSPPRRQDRLPEPCAVGAHTDRFLSLSAPLAARPVWRDTPTTTAARARPPAH